MAGIYLPDDKGADNEGEFLTCPSKYPLSPDEKKKRDEIEKRLGLRGDDDDGIDDTPIYVELP